MNRFDGRTVHDWKLYSGHRCIVIRQDLCAGGYEVVVIEVSPAGRPKFRFLSGNEGWKNKDEFLLVEDLGETNIVQH